MNNRLNKSLIPQIIKRPKLQFQEIAWPWLTVHRTLGKWSFLSEANMIRILEASGIFNKGYTRIMKHKGILFLPVLI